MFKDLLKKIGLVRTDPAANDLYAVAITEGRREIHFTEWGVPDTVDGRFDSISLIVALINRRIGLVNPDRRERLQELAQELFDVMFADIDVNLRLLGVSDEAMKHRIKPMASGHLGRVKAYTDALAAPDEAQRLQALSDALTRNIYREVENPDPAPLARRMIELARQLEAFSDDDVLAGRITFTGPGPTTFTGPGPTQEGAPS